MDITHLKIDTSDEPLPKSPAACCTANYPAMTLMTQCMISLYQNAKVVKQQQFIIKL